MNPNILLITAFLVNFIVSFVLVRFIYFPKKKNKNYVFTFLALTTIIFFVVVMLRSVELSIGVSFGLFAIFSVLHYRTNTIPPREMTYVFSFMALPIINSSLLTPASWPFVLTANVVIVVLFAWLELGWGFDYECSKVIKCTNTNHVLPENRDALLEDLQQKTGINILRMDIQDIDFVKDSFSVKIFFKKP